MQIIQFLAIEIAIPLGIVALLHFKIGNYPQSLPLEENKWKGIWETLIIWALSVIVLTMIIFSNSAEKMADPTLGTLLQFILITAVPYILIPVLYLRLVKKWTLKDFGFRKTAPNSRAVIIFAVILFAIAGTLPLLNSGFSPISVLLLLFALYQPAFIEEFFFRSIIQGRLERILGQNKAWIYGGILFGLAHFFVNYYVTGLDLASGIFMLIGQITAGWMFGIIYMKTRSLWPGILVHYLTDGRLASIIAMIS
ncbi:lysostaphin resistance A-like protein [candidate division KSB1 bacterium]